MTVNELLAKLKSISEDGYGDLTIQNVITSPNYNLTKYNIEEVNVTIGINKKNNFVALESR